MSKIICYNIIDKQIQGEIIKNFIWGIVTALIVIAIIYGIYKLVPGFKNAKEKNRIEEQGIECQNINPGIEDYGSLKLQVLYQGQPASNLEVDISQTPGADEYCFKTTDSAGFITINKMPTGDYFIYFNMSNYPDKYGIPSAEENLKINKDETLEMSMDLVNYQK